MRSKQVFASDGTGHSPVLQSLAGSDTFGHLPGGSCKRDRVPVKVCVYVCEAVKHLASSK